MTTPARRRPRRQLRVSSSASRPRRRHAGQSVSSFSPLWFRRLSERSRGASVHLESGDHAHGRVEYPAVVREEASEDVVAWCKAGQREPARPVRTDHAWSTQRPREGGGRAPLPTTAEPADEAGRGLAVAEPEDRPVVRNRIAVQEAVDARPTEVRREHEAEARLTIVPTAAG